MENQIQKPQKISKIKTAYKACKEVVKGYWGMPIPEKMMAVTGTMSLAAMVFSTGSFGRLVVGSTTGLYKTQPTDLMSSAAWLTTGIAYSGITLTISGMADIVRKTKINKVFSGPEKLGIGTVLLGLGWLGVGALAQPVGSPEFSYMAWTAGGMIIGGPISALIASSELKKERVKVKTD